MKLQKMLFVFLLSVGAHSFAMMNEGAEQDDRAASPVVGVKRAAGQRAFPSFLSEVTSAETLTTSSSISSWMNTTRQESVATSDFAVSDETPNRFNTHGLGSSSNVSNFDLSHVPVAKLRTKHTERFADAVARIWAAKNPGSGLKLNRCSRSLPSSHVKAIDWYAREVSFTDSHGKPISKVLKTDSSTGELYLKSARFPGYTSKRDNVTGFNWAQAPKYAPYCYSQLKFREQIQSNSEIESQNQEVDYSICLPCTPQSR